MGIGAGTRLGSYEILSPLAAGGRGEVWRATHVLLGRPAAIKVIRPESLGSGSDAHAKALLRRFEREARATSALGSLIPYRCMTSALPTTAASIASWNCSRDAISTP